MSAQRRYQRSRQRFCQQGLRHLGRNQDEHPVATVLVTAVIPRDPRTIKRILHRAVQTVADCHLMGIGTALIPKPLNVNDHDRPVNGQPPVFHRPTAI